MLEHRRAGGGTPVTVIAFERAAAIGLEQHPRVAALLEHPFQKRRRNLRQVADARLALGRDEGTVTPEAQTPYARAITVAVDERPQVRRERPFTFSIADTGVLAARRQIL